MTKLIGGRLYKSGGRVRRCLFSCGHVQLNVKLDLFI